MRHPVRPPYFDAFEAMGGMALGAPHAEHVDFVAVESYQALADDR